LADVGRGTPIPPTANAVKNLIGVYRTPLIEVSTRIVVTNTQPVGAYRGAGRPEANYYMERLVDTAAAEMGLDRVDLRRRNHIPEGAMPHKGSNGTTYDSGEFTAVLHEAGRPLSIILMRLRVAEIDQHAIAHIPGDEAIEPGDDFADGAVIGGDDLAIILGIEAPRQRGRADEIAEHHRELAPLGIGSSRGQQSRSRASGRCQWAVLQNGDGSE
jgi:hypothetical protein